MAHHRGRDTNFRCNPEFGADSLMISFRSLTGLILVMEIILKISAIQQLTFSRFRDLLTVGRAAPAADSALQPVFRNPRALQTESASAEMRMLASGSWPKGCCRRSS